MKTCSEFILLNCHSCRTKLLLCDESAFFNTHTAMGSKESKTGTDIVIYSAEPIFERRPKSIRKHVTDSMVYLINYLCFSAGEIPHGKR